MMIPMIMMVVIADSILARSISLLNSANSFLCICSAREIISYGAFDI